MAYYKTQIKSVGAGYAVDTSGKRLSFIGYYPCKAGDFVWTDGRVVFGNVAPKPEPIVFDVNNSGIPVLGFDKQNNLPLRGYYNKNGKFKDFPIDEDDLSDEILDVGNLWFVNNKFNVFWDWFPSWQDTNPYEDVEVSDNNVFSICRYLGSGESSSYFEIFTLTGDSEYELTKNFDDFKNGDEEIELLFLKLQKGNDEKKPVKWFAAFRTVRSTSSKVQIANVKRITLIQHSEVVQEISFTQPEIRNCYVDVVEEDVETYADWVVSHEEIFTIDSDGNKKVFYICDSSGYSSSINELKTDKLIVESEGTTVLPAYPGIFNVTNFEGTATTYWTGIGTAEATCEGTWYKVIKEPVPVDLSNCREDESFFDFKYPVQDGFYISGNNINSNLKLYDSDDKLVLDFSTSGDDVLSKLTGFHNFAAILTKNAIKLSDREYLLTYHDLNFKDNPSYLWLIKKGKVTRISDHCYNYRFNQMKDIKRARR